MHISRKLYKLLLKLYPVHFRKNYAQEMLQLFDDKNSEDKSFQLWLLIIKDLLISVPREHMKGLEMKNKKSIIYVVVLGIASFAATIIFFSYDLSYFYSVIATGVIVGLVIRENKVWPFSKKGVPAIILFSIVYGLLSGILMTDDQGEISLWNNIQVFLIFGSFTLPLSLFGLYIGMIAKGVTEKIRTVRRSTQPS